MPHTEDVEVLESRNYKFPESVLVIVYTRKGEVLLLQRRQPRGYWQSVTGSLKSGETPKEAATREIKEETGLDAAGGLVDCHIENRFLIAPAWRHRYAPGITHNTEHVFTLVVPKPCRMQLNQYEHVVYDWFKRDVAATMVDSRTNREAILDFVKNHE